MLRTLREAVEFRACILGLVIIRFAGIYWLLVLAFKFFAKEPLLYEWSVDEYTQETVPVSAAFYVQAIALGYQLLTRPLLREPADSLVLLRESPKIAVVSLIVLWMWSESKPVAGASYVPLVALAAMSVVGAVLVRWGPLARGGTRRSVTSAGTTAEDADAQSVGRWSKPRRTFADVYGQEQLKERLLQAGREVMRSRKGQREPGRNGILLYGDPGGGKSLFAEALAGELRLPLLTLSYSDVASRWVGEKTSRVRAVFQDAIRRAPCVLFLDEADSFLDSREMAAPSSVKEDRDLVNALLTLMVDLRKSRVLLIAATNRMDGLDPAAIREGRFDFKIEVPAPDQQARIGLLRRGISVNLPGAQVPTDLVETVARRWNGYSTKRLLAITEELPAVLHRAGRKTPEFSDFMDALRSVQGHAGAPLENVRPLNELVLSERTRIPLQNVLTRMRDPENTERHGGTLPTGVVFSGPPGTGKTAAAKALAKELGWTFLASTGAELSRDVAALGRLYAKAKEQRPAIIFVDEADELLRRREFSANTEATNKLLTLMDGAADRVRDVVWIAATNHLDQIDPAVLRGGRFSEKVAFELPSREALRSHLTTWLKTRSIQLEPTFTQSGLAELVGEASIADAEAVTQAAVNLAIGRGAPVVVTRRDVLDAIQIVLG
jgi:transitional endoplasmic reticulum ATPase